MPVDSLIQFAMFLGIVTILVRPVGLYLFRVFHRERTFLDPVAGRVELMIYSVCGIDPNREMTWKRYSGSFILFGLAGTDFIYLILMIQHLLPWFFSDYQTTPLTWHLALNTAVSFATTTTWQAHVGENTMSYVSQVIALTTQNFLSGAAGLAVGIAFLRGLARTKSETIGYFWVDVTRAVLWVLLPIAIIGTIALVALGVPLNFSDYTVVDTITGGTQVIAQGPVAVLEVIKNLGTNGGGFFNANGGHPYEAPSILVKLLNMLAIAVLPAALTFTFGRMVRDARQGWLIYSVMTGLFVIGLIVANVAEQGGNPALDDLGANQSTSIDGGEVPGGNMEGKEIRFGIAGSVLTAVTTSNGATGSYNAMHDSFTPIGVLVPLTNMLLGEIIFGGLGTGIMSMLVIVLIAIFLAGMMIGRTPEYLGKQIGPQEFKIVLLVTLLAPMTILGLTAIAITSTDGLAGLTTNSGAHGFTEIIYAYTTSFMNNGQNMAGLSANSPFYNVTTGLAMLIGRFGPVVLGLGLAGILARQSRRAATAGTLPTHKPLFGLMIAGCAIIIGALTYFPALALSPIAEQLMGS